MSTTTASARDIALNAAFEAHNAACAAIDPAALEVALARREAGNDSFHSDAVAAAVRTLTAADAEFSAAMAAAEALNT